MRVLLTPLLSFLQSYGYPMLWLTTFVAAFGAPLPMTLLFLAAGAFSATGDFNVLALAAVAISAAVAGDTAGYWVGRLWGSQILDWVAGTRLGKRVITPRTLARSRDYFKRRGGWAILLTRVLVTALGSVTNLVAGSELFPFRWFILVDILGETLSVTIPLTLGFLVGASWEEMGDVMGAISLFSLAAACALFLGYYLLRKPVE